MGKPDDYGPVMNASLWTCVAFATIFLGLRLFAKFWKHRGLWWDDYFLIGAWSMLIISVGINTKNVSLGFGKKLTAFPPDFDFSIFETVGLLGNLGGNASMFGIAWSKTSFALTLLRVVEGRMKWAIWFIMITVNLSITGMVIMTWARCSPVQKNYKTTLPGHCWDAKINADYMIFASAYSGIMDIVLALLPWQVLWGLQLNLKEKLGVGIAMSLGIFAGVIAFIKCSVLPSVGGPNFNYDGSLVIIWVEVENVIAIIAASIPVLRVFFKDLKSSARGYYAYGTDDNTKRSRIGNNTVVVTANRTVNRRGSVSKHMGESGLDDDSDKSILDGRHGTSPSSGVLGGITRTKEITVDYDAARDGDSARSEGYEMEQMGGRRHDHPHSPGMAV
ncbi:conserved hypothetical protein [Verticillium alfalfae VaMs.102]|uniref:Rhodopsin domain-containing protein n=1 Tax=Verticillium alfalfae (strain VaMs.102 / ATCC MYA-4576 / FGSC 10136) TaxID=526221 RepID=C9SCL4_VERA1|nr:conserved hypothetical protein [Verticillium alfalfae VaMs.102]EEY16829.1 conserved hypothetical protein [Verticillium alfalfae VaMs.102]